MFVFWVFWVDSKPVSSAFFVGLNSFIVSGPIGVVSWIMGEMIPVVLYKFYWCWSCGIINIVTSSKWRVCHRHGVVATRDSKLYS